MRNMIIRGPARRVSGRLLAALISVGLFACTSEQSDVPTVPGRWYTAAQVELGGAVFETHCASCHGASAEATPDWRQADEYGNYPPPPLNGSAHAWHHPLPVLQRSILSGGIPLGGVMPGFGDVVSENEALATIAYFQSLWSDEIYLLWSERNDSSP